MTDEQKILFGLLKEIHEICERHDIVYYLAGGTMIGALRHKGFIPWDDDVDVAMTRDEFERFKEAFKEESPKDRALDCQDLNRDYPNMFARYVDTSKAAIHKNETLGDGDAGYIIDIFPLDPVPDAGPAYENYQKKLMLYSDFVNPALMYSYRFGWNKDEYAEYSKRIEKEGKVAVLKEIEDEIFSYPEDECDYLVRRWGGVAAIFPKDMFGSSRREEFEGLMCRVPDRAADYLVLHYGDDWMYIPPHGEQESHDAIFSHTTSYKVIQDDYMQFIDIPATREAIKKRKDYFFENMDQNVLEKDMIAKTIAIGARMTLEASIKEARVDIFKELENKNYALLSDLFSQFYKIQMSRDCIGREDFVGNSRLTNPMFSDVDDDTLYVLVMVLIHTNRMAKGMRLLDVREHAKGELSDKLKEARDLILRIREVPSALDLKKYDEAWEKTVALMKEIPENEFLNMFYCQQLVARGDMAEARKAVENAMAMFPKNGVFNKYLGDCMLANDRNAAYDQYRIAQKNTKNGMILREIDEIMEEEA